jgi:hypothetical protein
VCEISSLRTKYLTLTTNSHVFFLRLIVNVGWFRQYVDQPVVPSCNVLFNATNAGNIVSVLGTSGLETATAERLHTVDTPKLYEKDV